MKALITADLHQTDPNDKGLFYLDKRLKKYQPDVAILLGDIFESNVNPVMAIKALNKLSKTCKIIYVFGNHEFWDKTNKETEEDYRKALAEVGNSYVHILDLENFVDFGDYRFVGNVLWFDGSMKTVPDQNISDFANGCWNDKLIKDFDWLNECKIRKKRILDNISSDKTNVLCTHCVPDTIMNAHLLKSYVGSGNYYNAFSGCSNFISECNPLNKAMIKYAFSGHTHLPARGENCGCKMYNVGSNYLFRQSEDAMVSIYFDFDSGEVIP